MHFILVKSMFQSILSSLQYNYYNHYFSKMITLLRKWLQSQTIILFLYFISNFNIKGQKHFRFCIPNCFIKQVILNFTKKKAQQPMSDKHEDFEDDHFDDDEQGFQAQKPTYIEQYEQTPQQKLQKDIMEYILNNSEKTDDTISEEVEEKLKDLLQKMPRKNQQQILTIRMHELALSKILVFTHGKSDFRLVKAHYHIGQAYLNYKCYEQAIDHLTIALKKNSKFTEIKETKLYHSYMLTTLSRCYFEINSYDDALEVLTRAYDIQQGFNPKNANTDEINNLETLQLMANCYLKLKDFQNALKFINNALELIIKLKKPNGQKTKEYAFANLLKSKIFTESKENLKGIESIKQSIQILNSINYHDKEEVANLFETLSTYYESMGDFDKQIEALRSRYEVLEEIYGHADRKALTAKRTVAMTLLKREKFKEAIEELQEVQEIQQKVYGENSTQVGKTLKVLGTVHMRNKNINEAQHYLKKAQKILHEQGHPKLVKEIKTKLTYLKQMKEGAATQPVK